MKTKVTTLLPSLLIGVAASGLLTILRSTNGITDIFYFILALFFTFPLSMLIEGAVRKLINAIQEKGNVILWGILTLLSPLPLLFLTLGMLMMSCC